MSAISTPITNTVVAWDGTPAASGAVDWAAARQHGTGSLRIVRVVDAEVLAPDYEKTQGDPGKTRHALDAELARVREAYPQLTVTSDVVVGDREAELVKLTAPDTLLVLGRKAHHGPRLLFRLSIVTRVAAIAEGPVAVIPDGAAHREGVVMAGVDGSSSSIAAGLLAASIAADRGVKLVALHVWQEATEWSAIIPIETDVRRTFEAKHKAVLAEALTPIIAAFPDLEIERRLIHERRLEGVMKSAGHASVLVLGKHGRSSFGEALLGSVSQTVVLNSHTPTVIVGSAEVEAVEEAEVTSTR